MARKEKTFPVPARPEGSEPSRDQGKVYLITEMDAMRAEKWAMRALLGLTRSDIDIPLGIERMGWAGVAYVGLNGLKGLRWEEAEPLFDEMLTCVQVLPQPENPLVRTPLLPGSIEEIDTLLLLRREVFDLHAGFLMTVFRSVMTERTAKDPT